MNEEIIRKAKEARTVEELIALFQENGIRMTDDQAKTVFDKLHATAGELSDDELDSVAGGRVGGGEALYCCRPCQGLYVRTYGGQYSCPNCGRELELFYVP